MNQILKTYALECMFKIMVTSRFCWVSEEEIQQFIKKKFQVESKHLLA